MANQSIPATVDLNKYIETRFFGERPHIRGRRVPVAVVVYFARDNNRTISELTDDFNLSEPEVLAALLYYAEHKDVIDIQQVMEQALFDQHMLRERK